MCQKIKLNQEKGFVWLFSKNKGIFCDDSGQPVGRPFKNLSQIFEPSSSLEDYP